MQKENKNQETIPSSEKKVTNSLDYTIQTMESDLKKSSPREASVELFEKKEEKKEDEGKKEKVEERVVEKNQAEKNFNPFLKDLKPIEKFEPVPKNLVPLSSKKEDSLKEKFSINPKLPQKNLPSVEKKLGDKKPNSFLLLFLFILSLIAIGAGVYYYYFHLNASEPKKLIQEELVFNEEPVIEQIFSEKLQASQSLNIEENVSLTTLLKNQKENILTSTNKYYQIKQTSEKLTPSEVLSSLDIKLPEEILNNLGEVWIMAYNQENVLKINLVLEVTQNLEETKEIIINNEYRLPQLLKPLFIDEDFVLQDEEIIFKDSVAINGIRYYNLVESFDTKAIDWGIIDDKYLIITTSKETANLLLEEL